MSIEVAPGHCCQVLSTSPLSGVVEMIGQPDVRPQLHGELISALLGARYQGCPRNIRKSKLRHRRGSNALEFLWVSCLRQNSLADRSAFWDPKSRTSPSFLSPVRVQRAHPERTLSRRSWAGPWFFASFPELLCRVGAALLSGCLHPRPTNLLDEHGAPRPLQSSVPDGKGAE